MEAVACREGVAFARSLGVQKIQVESDSQELLKIWEMGELQRSRISPIIKEIKELSIVFHDFSLVYANRSCNHVAHTLAKQVSEGNEVVEWQSAPPCITNPLTEDCTGVP